MRIRFTYRTIAGGALLVLAHGVLAAGPAKEGDFAGMTCFSGPAHVIAGVKGQVGGSYDLMGTSIRNEGELGYLGSERCVGHFVVIGAELTDSGSCLLADPDGDQVFLVFSRKNQEPGTWKATGGTGKYEGIEASGTFVGAVRPPKRVLPDVLQVCNKETGHWKLK
jgi:hypothetical protein